MLFIMSEPMAVATVDAAARRGKAEAHLHHQRQQEGWAPG
jgi:hypothetical protein